MKAKKRSRGSRFVLLAGVVGLVLAGWACGSESVERARSGSENAADRVENTSVRESAPVHEHSSNRQPGADDMRVAIVSPTDGSSFSSNQIALGVDVNGFDLSCDAMGRGDRVEQGHLHVYLDDVLVNYYCTPNINISMQNKKPGTHTVKVVPAENSHREVEDSAETIEVNWQPTSPPPVIQPANFSGEPTVHILQPNPDETVSGNPTVRISVKSFNLSCDLMGKDGVEGYGHWHASLATGSVSETDPGSLLAMGCDDSFELPTAGLKKGAIYTLVVQLTENGHSPIAGASDQIQIRIA